MGSRMHHLKPVYMRWASPVCLDWPLVTGLVRLMLYFFVKIIVVFICKGGQARLTRSLLEKPASWKQASPPSRIKWKQGMSWTSLVKQASRLANRAAWLNPSSKISVFHESSHEIQSIFILYCFPPIGAFRKQSLFYKYYRKNLTNYSSQLSTNYN